MFEVCFFKSTAQFNNGITISFMNNFSDYGETENNFNVIWGSILLKHLYNLGLKFKENWPKKGGTIKTSFLGTVIKNFLGTYN